MSEKFASKAVDETGNGIDVLKLKCMEIRA